MGPRDMSRRTFIKCGMAAAAEAMTLPLAAAAALSEPTTVPHANPHRGARPTRVDAHGHTVPGLTADRVISLMDQAGISHMVLMARGLNDRLTTDIHKQYPQRILPFVGTMYPAWHRQDERVLAYAENQLGTGIFNGVGEVMLRYYGIPSWQELNVITYRATSGISRIGVIRENSSSSSQRIGIGICNGCIRPESVTAYPF